MFRAYESARERLVAVKLFRLDLPPERVHLLVAELERIVDAKLDHPAIAAPLAAGMVGVSAYLAQEYVAADSLDSVVREFGAAPPTDALRVAAQLAGALDFAAVVNVTHGAMHPRDILLSSDDTRLTGIGITHALARVGVTAPVRRPYTAPERVAGAEWDRRADVFTLAAVVHELLWARRPADTGARAADALTEISGGDLDALRSVFARALADNPAERYATALDFADALDAAFPSLTIARAAASAPVSDERVPVSSVAPQEPDEPRLPLLVESETAHASDLLILPPAAVPVSAEAVDRSPVDDPVLLKTAEAARYQDVELAPALVDEEPPRIVAPALVDEQPPRIVAPPPVVRAAQFAAEPSSAFERTRSAVWPLVLALGVGLAVGFASGYGVGTHTNVDTASTVSMSDATDSAPLTANAAAAPRSTAGQTSTQPAPPPSNATRPAGGREFTESTVAAPPDKNTGRRAAEAAPAASTTGRPSAAARAAAIPAPVAPFDGRLLVRSTPAGARVSVDGRDYGRTPAAIRELDRGAHRVRVMQDGYSAAEQRVVLTTARPSQSLTFAMTPGAPAATGSDAAQGGAASSTAAGALARYSGTLVVDSRPTGAKVYVDGRLAGTTPLSLPDVRAGEHAIRLEHEGYRRWSSSVRVVAAEQNRVTASLER